MQSAPPHSGRSSTRTATGAALRRAPRSGLNAMPELALMGTAYEPTIMSKLWMSGKAGGLGYETRQVYAILASMAIMERSEKVRASGTYLTRRLGGEWPAVTVRKHMAKLREHGLITTMNKHVALHWIPPMSENALAALLVKLGVNEAAKWNVIEANWDSLRKAEEWPSWDAEEAIG